MNGENFKAIQNYNLSPGFSSNEYENIFKENYQIAHPIDMSSLSCRIGA